MESKRASTDRQADVQSVSDESVGRASATTPSSSLLTTFATPWPVASQAFSTVFASVLESAPACLPRPRAAQPFQSTFPMLCNQVDLLKLVMTVPYPSRTWGSRTKTA